MVFHVCHVVAVERLSLVSASFLEIIKLPENPFSLHIMNPTLTLSLTHTFTLSHRCHKKLSSACMQCYLSTCGTCKTRPSTENRANELVDSGRRGGAGFVRHSGRPTHAVASSPNSQIVRGVANTQPVTEWTKHWIGIRRIRIRIRIRRRRRGRIRWTQ